MDRDKWYVQKMALREILGRLLDHPVDREAIYCFGLQYNPNYGYHHLWDGVAKVTAATIALKPELAVIRFAPTWIFRYELMKFNFDRKTRYVQSENVNRHDDWYALRHTMQNRVARTMQQAESREYTEIFHFDMNVSGISGILMVRMIVVFDHQIDQAEHYYYENMIKEIIGIDRHLLEAAGSHITAEQLYSIHNEALMRQVSNVRPRTAQISFSPGQFWGTGTTVGTINALHASTLQDYLQWTTVNGINDTGGTDNVSQN